MADPAPHAAAALLLALIGVATAAAQDVFTAGDSSIGEQFSTGPCRDPQMERREGARAYLDTNGSVRAAANYLARKYDDPFINRGGACAESPGIVFLIPEGEQGGRLPARRRSATLKYGIG